VNIKKIILEHDRLAYWVTLFHPGQGGHLRLKAWRDLLRSKVGGALYELFLKSTGYIDQVGTDDGTPYVLLGNGLKLYGMPAWSVPELLLAIRLRYQKTPFQLKYYQPKSGDTIVELGAFIGLSTIRFAEYLRGEGRIIAVEIVPETYSVLEKNLTGNIPEISKCINAGISDRPGRQTFYWKSGTAGASLDKSFIDDFHPDKSVEIETCTIDQIVQGLECVDLLIIQLNGHEYASLAGMRDSIGTIRNMMITCPYPDKQKLIMAYLEENSFDVIRDRNAIFAHLRTANTNT